MNKISLSPQAAHIEELIEGGMTIKVMLQQYPDLIDFLDEYVAYEKNEAQIEGRSGTSLTLSHSIVKQVEKVIEHTEG